MRTREEIESAHKTGDWRSIDQILEVLLDIRDLLTPNKH